MQYVKYGTELAGIPVGETRAPLQALSGEEKAGFAGSTRAWCGRRAAV
jgi:4-hydroxy-tetrahydrodipicolinate synthase